MFKRLEKLGVSLTAWSRWMQYHDVRRRERRAWLDAAKEGLKLSNNSQDSHGLHENCDATNCSFVRGWELTKAELFSESK